LIIDLQNITARMGRQTVLDDVSFRFDGGSIGLLGPNGAGKTTLLRTLLGFVEPQSGGGAVLGMDIRKDSGEFRLLCGAAIRYDGERRDAARPRDPLLRRIGRSSIPQD
jgi:ABC-2 type transport system ATP-binding protein